MVLALLGGWGHTPLSSGPRGPDTGDDEVIGLFTTSVQFASLTRAMYYLSLLGPELATDSALAIQVSRHAVVPFNLGGRETM